MNAEHPAARGFVHAVVDALLAANLLHDPDLSVTGDGSGTALPLIRDPRDDEARIERALVAVWRVRLLPASALNGQSRSEAIARAALAAADQEDIARAARALWDAEGMRMYHGSFDRADGYLRRKYLAIARAALAAYRSPEEADRA